MSEEWAAEGKPIEGEPLPEERAAEGESIEGEPLPEERTMEGESIEGEPLPEERAMEGESIEGEPLPEERAMECKSIAVERESAGSHETAAASKGRPAKAVARKSGATKAATAKVPPAKTATSKAAVNGRRAQSRGGSDNHRGGQSSHYVAHHDAPPFTRRRTPAFKYETRQFPPGCSVRHCRSAGERPGAMKAVGGTDPNADEKLSGTACRSASAVVIEIRTQ